MVAAPTPGPRPAALPDPAYASHAWLRGGRVGHRRATPGVLALRSGRLSFVGEGVVVFDERLGDRSAVAFPWYRGRGGLTVTVAGRRRRLSLSPPRTAASDDRPDSAAAEVADVVVDDLVLPEPPVDPDEAAGGAEVDGRRAGRIWRTLLTS